MRIKVILSCLTLLLLGPAGGLVAQDNAAPQPDSLFVLSGEVFFSFDIGSPMELAPLSRIISIANYTDNHIFAYANRKEFARFLELGYSYTVLPHPGSLLEESQLRPPESGKGPETVWNFYPTYQEYMDFMDNFAVSHPDICKLVPIGTSVQGRELIAVKISDNVNESEAEPEFFYTSSIHGDELTGYVLMLHLIDHLLSNYGTDPRITDLVDHMEIFINPLANPDGTYWGGNNSVSQAKRYNANWVDLNRNYPDPEDGPHPDGNEWQAETIAFMAFADSNHFVMGANFHTGAEVFNYPWDTWPRLAADDAWWQFVGHEYVDTVHAHSPGGYFSGFNNGITNGYQWYTISGGRQDYMNYWHSDREVTLELSDVFLPPASQLLNFWEYNYRSLINYLEQARYGIQGTVTDSVTGEPLAAEVYIPFHDQDNSQVTTKLPSGYYSRLLYEGTYDVRFSATGYFPKMISDIVVSNRATTPLDVKLVPLNIGIEDPLYKQASLVYPNPSNGLVDLVIPGGDVRKANVEIFSITGKRVFTESLDLSAGGTTVSLDLQVFAPGLYLVKLTCGGRSYSDRIIIR